MLFWFVLQKFVLAVLFISIIPPPQPPAGARGADYICDVKSSVYNSREKQLWIFEPEGMESAPVVIVIFLHGWSAMTPEPYLLWIEHTTKKGKIVIYSRYQRDIFTEPEDFTPNAIEEIRDAIEVTGEHTKPELDKIAVVGHSAGGISIMAATAQSSLSQQVKALMCVEPGVTERDGRKVVPLYDLASKIPMLVVGDRDENVGDRDARKIFIQSTGVKTKNYVIVHSDYYGFWKLFDGLCDPVKELEVYEKI